jgi:hypothetical protein
LGILIAILEGQDPATMSVSQRMSWAASPQTTWKEDLAYSLIGLFDIYMLLLYGKGGRNAFIQLQEEIVKRTDDKLVFAWKLPDCIGRTTGGL